MFYYNCEILFNKRVQAIQGPLFFVEMHPPSLTWPLKFENHKL